MCVCMHPTTCWLSRASPHDALPRPRAGDGGRGGHIILKGSRQWNTLQHLRNKRTIAADDGEKGGSMRVLGGMQVNCAVAEL